MSFEQFLFKFLSSFSNNIFVIVTFKIEVEYIFYCFSRSFFFLESLCYIVALKVFVYLKLE